MKIFRKKPIVIEATQWFENGDHPEGRVVRYFRSPDPVYKGKYYHDAPGCLRSYHDHGWIDTPEGGHIVCPGDWIITGVQGESYPCKPDIFEQTYEAVE